MRPNWPLYHCNRAMLYFNNLNLKIKALEDFDLVKELISECKVSPQLTAANITFMKDALLKDRVLLLKVLKTHELEKYV